MAKKKFDPKAKAKRQKVIAAIGGVLLLGLLAFQVPRTMKMLKQNQGTSSSSSAASSASTTPGSTPLAPPGLDGSSTAGASVASATATSVDGVSDPSNPLPPAAGQLVSFSMFKSKDPFHQQITDCASAAGSGSDSGSGAAASSACATVTKAATKKAAKPGAAAGAVVSAKSAATAKASAQAPAKVTKATITVNGVANLVSVGTSFPTASPVFTLVSLTSRAAKIGIAGGSYQNGEATVTLAKGKTVTLMNTADGTRYVLRLVAVA
ncbi:MAG TPA: hypothetical protein VE757_08600 [Gaiellaceae bacterium]|nr:hypothetical protein [Gaiellaceae bacterium]